ncbi:MAG: ROK family protein [Microthrixaceae bacterium]
MNYLDLDGTMVRSYRTSGWRASTCARSRRSSVSTSWSRTTPTAAARRELATSTEEPPRPGARSPSERASAAGSWSTGPCCGANGFAGEPGTWSFAQGASQCVCGQRGCWERYASGSALAAMAAPGFASAEEGLGRPRNSRRGGGEFCAGWPWASRGVVNLLDPEVVLIGGGLASALDVMGPHINTELEGNPTVAHRVPPVRSCAPRARCWCGRCRCAGRRVVLGALPPNAALRGCRNRSMGRAPTG